MHKEQLAMERLDIKLGKERQCHIKKQLVHSFSVKIRISQPSVNIALVNITILGLTNPDVNRKRMHQLYAVILIKMYNLHRGSYLSAPLKADKEDHT